MSKLIDIRILLITVLSLVVACNKETDSPSPALEVHTMHYRASIQTEMDTKVALGDGMAYKYETGDRVYVESEDGKIYGFLTMSDDTGIGNNVAFFEGLLTYVGDLPQDSNLPVSLVLVSGTDDLHTITDGKVEGVTGSSYGQGTWASSLEDAVRRLSHFTGSGNLKDKTFTLHQQSSFLKCSVRMPKSQAPVNRIFTAKLLNNNVPLREVSVKVTNAGKLPFVFAFLGGDVSLEDAKLVIEWTDSNNTDQSEDFSVAGQTLAANTYYSISRSTLSYKGFSITGISNGTTIKFNYGGIEYSLDDGETWTPYSAQFTLNADDIACIKGSQTNYKNDGGDQYGTPSNKPIFEANKKCYISGNIMSLLADQETLSESAFQGAFSKGSSNAVTYIDIHPDDPLILPVTTLAPKCYMQMFRNCTSLTRAPIFRVEGTAYRCCYNMFRDCKNLVDVSGIELPAMTLSQDCYRELFRKCEKITTSPDLPALNLEQGCYQQMFSDCYQLGYIKCLTTTNVNVKNGNDYQYTNNWVSNAGSSVSSKSFFKNPDNNSWMQNNNSGIPSGWTVVDYTE